MGESFPCFVFFIFLAWLFSKKMLRYCHSPFSLAAVAASCKKLTFSNISVITEDMYLKLRVVVSYPKGNPYQ